MQIHYELMSNTEDIYELFNELEKDFGLRYVHTVPDPLMAAQGFEFIQYDHKALLKEEDGRNLQYKGFLLAFMNKEDCERYFEEFTDRMGNLKWFHCVYCKTSDLTGTVIFNTVDSDGHPFGKFEEKRFMSLFSS